MSIVKKYSRTVMGLSALGFASVSPIAHADSQVESRQMMEYKSQKFGKTLIIADRFYPSTQRCSSCGFIKTGDDKITLSGNIKHGTRHNEYICYQCGYKDDRDHNAVLNLLALAE